MFDPITMIKALPGGSENLAKLVELFKAARALTAAVDAFEHTEQINADDEAHENMVKANALFKSLMADLPKIPGVTDGH